MDSDPGGKGSIRLGCKVACEGSVDSESMFKRVETWGFIAFNTGKDGPSEPNEV